MTTVMNRGAGGSGLVAQNYVTPRIACSQLSRFKGKLVCIMIEVVDLEAHALTAKCLAGGEPVRVINMPTMNNLTRCIEVIVEVTLQGELRYISHTPLDDDIDRELIQKTLELINTHHSSLFW